MSAQINQRRKAIEAAAANVADGLLGSAQPRRGQRRRSAICSMEAPTTQQTAVLEALESRLVLSALAVHTVASFDSDVYPRSLTIDAAGNLFGTAFIRGNTDVGTIFEIPRGSNSPITLATVASYPNPELIVDAAGNLFGTIWEGGANGAGAIFELPAGHSTITLLASFSGYGPGTGATPHAGLATDSAGNLFGATTNGGANGYGTVFELPAGTHTIQALASFNGSGTTGYNGNGLGTGGVAVDSADNVYGATNYGGTSDDGSVFEVVAGSGTITTLASFNGSNGSGNLAEGPSVILNANGDIFGTTSQGGLGMSSYGTGGYGTVYEIPRGSGTLNVLGYFDGTNGAYPNNGLILDSAGDLIGTTSGAGATNWAGTVFEIPAGTTTINTLASLGANTGTSTGVVMDSTGNLFGTSAYGNSFGTIYEVTQQPPSVNSINRAGASPSIGINLSFTVNFSWPVTGVNASDFQLATTGTITASPTVDLSPTSGPSSAYTVTVHGISGDGTLGLNLVNHGDIVDENGTPLSMPSGTFIGQAYTRYTWTGPLPMPNAPFGTTATAVSASDVQVRFYDNSDNETGFVIQRASSATGPYSTVFSAPAHTGTGYVTFDDTTVSAYATYYYKVAAVDGTYQSALDGPVSATTLGPAASPAPTPLPNPGGMPNAPFNTTAQAVSSSDVQVKFFDNSDNETGFVVRRALAANGPYSTVFSVPAHDGNGYITFDDTTASPGTTYYYQVAAVNDTLYQTTFDGPVNVTTPGTTPTTGGMPNAPYGTSATAVSTSDVRLTFYDNSDNETGFTVLRSTSPTFASYATINIPAHAGMGYVTYDDLNVGPITTYYYKVAAVNGSDLTTNYDGPATATTPAGSGAQPPPIVLPNPGGMPNAPFGISATAVSASDVQVQFFDNSTNETGFVIQRATSASGPFTPLVALPAHSGTGTVTYDDITVSAGGTYYYQVAAVNNSDYQTDFDGPASATTPGVPAQNPGGVPNGPFALSATPLSATQVVFQFHDNSTNEQGFNIESAPTANGPWTPLNTTAAFDGTGLRTVFVNTPLAASPTFYRVSAVNGPYVSSIAGPVAADQVISLSLMGLAGGSAVQPDGKTVSLVSAMLADGTVTQGVQRTNPDGSLDTTFGVNGTATLGTYLSASSYIHYFTLDGLQLLPDQRILVTEQDEYRLGQIGHGQSASLITLDAQGNRVDSQTLGNRTIAYHPWYEGDWSTLVAIGNGRTVTAGVTTSSSDPRYAQYPVYTLLVNGAHYPAYPVGASAVAPLPDGSTAVQAGTFQLLIAPDGTVTAL